MSHKKSHFLDHYIMIFQDISLTKKSQTNKDHFKKSWEENFLKLFNDNFVARSLRITPCE
jgi:hypothetical protein